MHIGFDFRWCFPSYFYCGLFWVFYGVEAGFEMRRNWACDLHRSLLVVRLDGIHVDWLYNVDTMQFFAALLLWNFAAWCLFSHRLVAGHQFDMIALCSLSPSQSHSLSLISQNELPTTPFYFDLKHLIYPAKMLKITHSYRERIKRDVFIWYK